MTDLIPAWVNGTLTPVDKMAVHRQGLRHLAVSVFLMRGRETLIQQRASGKYHTPGLWANTCCTHPHWGEDPAACAQRRLRQELGVTGVQPAFAGQVEYRAAVGRGLTEHEVVEIFTCSAPDTMRLDPDPDEVQAVAWIDIYDLAADCDRHPDQYTPWLRIYMARHMDMLFGTLQAR